MRKSGVLLHITSLPGPGGIGTLGQEAYRFADFLHEGGMRLWQVLPLGPTGYGESPYQSSSVFAGNPMLISLEKLAEEGLIHLDSAQVFTPERLDRVDFEAVRPRHEALLRDAFRQCEGKLMEEIRAFLRKNPWVEDFALFTALKNHFGGVMWRLWPDEAIRLRRPEALRDYRQKLDEDVRFHIFCQYVFRRQWLALKAYCNARDIQLFGDMPIYVAEDSADTWTHPEVFQLDKNRVPVRVAGVPPDCFSEDGQLWGNPLYRWGYLFFRRYDWWVERMRSMAELYDVVRVDHFIGFANYYSIAYGSPTAKEGKWIVGPGKKLFRVLRRKLPGLNVVAEDLGVQSERVRRLLAYVGYPGMKVATFGFGGDADGNQHFPGNWTENYVAYTGTHDNDTTLGWLNTADPETLQKAKAFLHFTTAEEGVDAFIRCVLESRCDTAILPMQDLLHLGGEARMNLPGTIGGNWAWRMLPGAASPALAERLRAMNRQANRL